MSLKEFVINASEYREHCLREQERAEIKKLYATVKMPKYKEFSLEDLGIQFIVGQKIQE